MQVKSLLNADRGPPTRRPSSRTVVEVGRSVDVGNTRWDSG
jgi:hypothetical protein